MTMLKTRPASLSNSWDDVKKHVGPLAFTYLSTIVLSIVGLIIYFVVSLIFTAIGGGEYSDIGLALGLFFGSISALPVYILFMMISMFFYVIPALYFDRGEVISFSSALQELRSKFVRYFLAGLLFFAAYLIGLLLCLLPGFAVALTLPVYVNKIYNTNLSIPEAFSSSFSAVFKGQGWSFVGVEILGIILVQIVSLCTCGLGVIVAVPLFCFYLQNAAYNKGLVS